MWGERVVPKPLGYNTHCSKKVVNGPWTYTVKNYIFSSSTKSSPIYRWHGFNKKKREGEKMDKIREI